MVRMARAAAASRAAVTERPWLFGPSPETSITRRVASATSGPIPSPGSTTIATAARQSAITTTLFLGGWQPPFEFLDLGNFNWIWFAIKTSLVIFTFQWIRWSLPRLRMDQLMDLGWKILVPACLIWLFVTAGAMLIF